ncbi:MAG: hypothetical protein RL230_2557 [Pseudomonadota bacterium]
MAVRRWLVGVSLGLVMVSGILWFGGQRVAESDTRPSLPASVGSAGQGATAFYAASFGGLSMDALASNAVPWHLTAAALVLDEQRRDPSATLSQETLARVLAQFGFLSPASIVNLPEEAKRVGTQSPLGQTPLGQTPLGMTLGTIHPLAGTSILVSNLGCASCHAGVTYGPEGQPQPDKVMLGMPNTSLDLEAYTQAIFKALRAADDPERLVTAAQALFPEMTVLDRVSLRALVLPLAQQRLASLAATDRAMPFPNGSPGSTNGVAALKVALKTPLIGGGKADAGFVSIPDLGDRVFKTSLLADGAYGVFGKPAQSVMTPQGLDPSHLRALASITTFFTVPSMGVHPDQARGGLPDGIAIMDFLKTYRSQAFPGSIDTALAQEGGRVYQAQCASCHGTYQPSAAGPRLVSFPNWIGRIGTDPLRGDAFDKPLAEAVGLTSYRNIIAVHSGRGYVAPPLAGLWASAPYLHNGSVHSLRALLTPEARLKRFQVGGHALDLETVGIKVTAEGAFPLGYQPFSRSSWVETDELGRNNGGHDYGSDLSVAQKSALIEYLKTL